MTFGERLRTTRATRSLSLRAAAEELGIAPTSLRLWEFDVQRPGAERLAALAKWLEVDPGQLLDELAGAIEDLPGDTVGAKPRQAKKAA